MRETFTTRDRPGSPTETFTGSTSETFTTRNGTDEIGIGIDDGSIDGGTDGGMGVSP